jgi:uncharacterized protein YjbI with pentapeptide repeats
MNFTSGLKRTSIYAATVVLSLAATTANAACSDPAAPGVDWSGCDKSGARLSGANLAGADLSGADLTYANLYEADLSGASLTSADLTNAQLSLAVWVDGRICGEGSCDGTCN